ncbi:MAG: DUF4397 domain-containing protein [Actinobacteria bacterium]|nr:DUF4397 domain-containing protein [Actinomycetota bacterium]
MRKAMLFLTAMMLMLFIALPASAADGGKVTVIHGIPGLTVDVFVNGELAIPGFAPGDVAGPLDLPAGNYDLAIAPEGAGIDAAVLTGSAAVTDGLNASIVAYLSEAGDPGIAIFVNDTSTIAAGQSRLIVRHTAAAPTVDILLADGTPLFEGVTNFANGAPFEGKADVPAGTYDVRIAPAGAGVEAAVFSADGVQLPEGTARIVYATGSLADGSFGLVIQDIAGLGGTPGGVPTGDPSGSGVPMWVFLASALALLTLASVPAVAVRRSR